MGAVNSNILSSLSELDFSRIRAGHTSEHDTSSSHPTLSLTRQLLGAGYHRELRVNIKIQNLGGYSDSKVLLVENITHDMYVDLDQVQLHNHTYSPIHFKKFQARECGNNCPQGASGT
jgi:hypothetical protein